MTSAVALLTRAPSGALVGGAPLRRLDREPFIGCAGGPYCGPLCDIFPCPNADPTGPESIDAGTAREEEAVKAQILEAGADHLKEREFPSLEELVAYSVAHPRYIVALADDTEHPYQGGIKVEAKIA
jgi:hypothetical protein